MKCECENDIEIRFLSNLECKGCQALTRCVSIVTIQCDKCKKIFQIPLESKSFLSVKKGGKIKK